MERLSILALSIVNSAMEENTMKKIALITAARCFGNPRVVGTPRPPVLRRSAKFSTVSGRCSVLKSGLNVCNQKDELS